MYPLMAIFIPLAGYGVLFYLADRAVGRTPGWRLTPAAPGFAMLFLASFVLLLAALRIPTFMYWLLGAEDALHYDVVIFLVPPASAVVYYLTDRIARRRPESRLARVAPLLGVLFLASSIVLLVVVVPALIWATPNGRYMRFYALRVLPVPALCALLYSIAVGVTIRNPASRHASRSRVLFRDSFVLTILMTFLFTVWRGPRSWKGEMRLAALTLLAPAPFAILYYLAERMRASRLATASTVLARDLFVVTVLWLAVFLSWFIPYELY